MIGGKRGGLLLSVAAMTLLGGCGWFESDTPVSSKQVRPGAERSVAVSAGLPAASGSRQYDPSIAPVDETRSGPQVGSIVAGKGGQKAQQEALAKESAEGDRKTRAEADRVAAARKEADAASAAASPPKSSPASSPSTAQAEAPPPAPVTTTSVPPPTETAAAVSPAAASAPAPTPARVTTVATPPAVVEAAPAPVPVAVAAAPARPADPNKAFEPPPGWVPPGQTAPPAATVVTPPAPAAPPPVAAVADTPPPESVASRPAPTLATVSFMRQSVEIGRAGRAELDRIAQSGNGMRVIELHAYASGSDFTEARNVALARGLSVRSYLIDRGLRTRIEIGASAASSTGSDSDRVDILGP